MEKIEITKERILEAASKCSTAKETLKTLFPEVFEDNKYFDLTKLALEEDSQYIFIDKNSVNAGFESRIFMKIRDGGEYSGKAFYLDNFYNWEIKKDSIGALCLIPTKK